MHATTESYALIACLDLESSERGRERQDFVAAFAVRCLRLVKGKISSFILRGKAGGEDEDRPPGHSVSWLRVSLIFKLKNLHFVSCL